MKKKQIIVLGVVLGLALVGLIIMQARYFQTAFKLKKAQFDYAVNRSLDEVVACIEERDNLNERLGINPFMWTENTKSH